MCNKTPVKYRLDDASGSGAAAVFLARRNGGQLLHVKLKQYLEVDPTQHQALCRRYLRRWVSFTGSRAYHPRVGYVCENASKDRVLLTRVGNEYAGGAAASRFLVQGGVEEPS